MNFEKLCVSYLEDIYVNVKESTYVRYRDMIRNHILPYMNACSLEDVNLYMLEDLKRQLLKSGRKDGNGGLSPKSVSDILSLLKNIIYYGQNHDLNITCRPECLKVRREGREMRVLSPEEQKQLCLYLTRHMSRTNMGILLALHTGLRIGELCGLTWENVDLESGWIKIVVTIQRIPRESASIGKNGRKTHLVITQPKSSSSCRWIPVPEPLLPLLITFRTKPEDYLLSGLDTPVEPRTLQNRFMAVMRQTDIKGATFHTLRHTFATRCVESGFEIKSLSEILGHASVNITLNRYVHSSLELKKKNMKKMDAYLRSL